MPFHYKFYAIRIGRETGVFHDIWPNIEPLVSGYSGAYFKAFYSEQEADDFMQGTKAVAFVNARLPTITQIHSYCVAYRGRRQRQRFRRRCWDPAR
jgi:viroplasmin and RNaseH domain-containing protein